MTRNQHPIDNLFQEFDTDQEGSLTFENFANMNEYEGVWMPKKDLKRIFDLIDRNKNKRIRIEELRTIANLTYNTAEDENQEAEKNKGLSADEILIRSKTDEVYEEIKNKIEKLNTTLETIFFVEPVVDTRSSMNRNKPKKPLTDPAVITPLQQVTVNGIRQGLERI